MKRFTQTVQERMDRLSTRLIHALDLSLDLNSFQVSERQKERKTFFDRVLDLLSDIEAELAAVKINYPLLLSLGPELTTRLLEETTVPAIADLKVADIDNTSRWIARQAFGMGFEAIIAHPFVGYQGGLDGLFQEAEEAEKGVILVVNMSHPGSAEFITPQAEKLTEFASEHGADGAIAPATRPNEVREARDRLGDQMMLFTPGVGAQGGGPGDAVKAGADCEIVGRAIYQASDPLGAARRIKGLINEAVDRR